MIFNVIDAATNVYRPNGRATDITLLASDLIGYNDLVALEALHMDQGARPVQDGLFAFVTPPQVYAGLQKDPDWKSSHQFRDPEKIWRGEVGDLAGVAVVRTNAPGFSPTAQSTSGVTNKVYSSFIIGRQAYAITDLQGLRVYTIAPGGHGDELYQNRKISYKFAFKSVILNQNWIRRVRSSGANSVNTP